MLATKLLQLYISISYVLAIYVATSHHVSYKQRNEPQIIHQRMRNIIIMCGINVVLVSLLVSLYSGMSFTQCFLAIGIIPGYHFNGVWDLSQSIWDSMKAVTLIAVLYVGPLTDLLLHYIHAKDSIWEDFFSNFNDIWGVRNYVFAPVTEELVYTAMLISCHIMMEPISELTWRGLLLEPSLYFGIAHIHHAWELYQDGEYKLVQIGLITTLQAIYTTIFGTLSNYVYLRNGGNLYSCVLIHSTCNLLGVPSLHSESQSLLKSAHHKHWWSRTYVMLLLLGLASFLLLLVPLTASPYSL